MELAESEREAHGLVKLYIECWVPDSEVAVLNRDSVTDRLESSTPLPDGSPLREPLEAAEPRSCLAVRLARTHDSAGDPPPARVRPLRAHADRIDLRAAAGQRRG